MPPGWFLASLSTLKNDFRLKKQARKHRSDPKLNDSEMPADISVKEPKKGPAGCCIKEQVLMLAIIKIKHQKRRHQRQKEYLHNKELRLQRRCE